MPVGRTSARSSATTRYRLSGRSSERYRPSVFVGRSLGAGLDVSDGDCHAVQDASGMSVTCLQWNCSPLMTVQRRRTRGTASRPPINTNHACGSLCSEKEPFGEYTPEHFWIVRAAVSDLSIVPPIRFTWGHRRIAIAGCATFRGRPELASHAVVDEQTRRPVWHPFRIVSGCRNPSPVIDYFGQASNLRGTTGLRMTSLEAARPKLSCADVRRKTSDAEKGAPRDPAHQGTERVRDVQRLCRRCASPVRTIADHQQPTSAPATREKRR
jgi:hypothetical protein